ncbi:hypothetical protein ACFQX6_11825 [Streptosporangium lutulentum]
MVHPADLARWAAFVAGDTGGVLDPATVAEMREPAIVDDGDAWTGGYGLGLQLTRAAAAAWPGTPAPCRASWPPCGPTRPTRWACSSWPTPPRG